MTTWPTTAPSAAADFSAGLVVRLYVGMVDRHGRSVPEPVMRAALSEVGLSAWTLYRGEGRWRGGDEPTVILESVMPRAELPGALDDAGRLARLLGQSSVMVLVQEGAVAYVAESADPEPGPEPADPEPDYHSFEAARDRGEG